ncbi:WXG100 family type VII secretion target [Nocardia yunnanensis]|uniref:WXG100 family type VII secretion target n=1 Tax=Nocardia yunnanensis TaxID=2382165 RepID=A0A386ZKP7_9NOCA|nr:WXG100 family type VII secretion target [Nocardia yunnanensis]AYF77853.1 WXG100 family type VII secretion target [Nocardia yunnanensis]
MGTPTIPQVKAWDPDVLNTQAGEWEQKAKTLGDTLDAAARSVDGSHHYWIGDAGDSMRDRHDEIHGDAKTVKTALDNGATAARNGATAIQNAKTTLLNKISDAEGSGFTVSDTGEVKISTGMLMILQYAGDDKATLQAGLEHRAEEYQKAIQAALTDCGTADDDAMTAVNNAFANLTTTQIQQPTTNQLDQLTADQARKDLQAVKDGTADDATLARIRMATTLSDYDKQELNNGDTVGLPQYPYLQAFTQGMNDMSGEDIDQLGSKLKGNGSDQVKDAIANDLRIISDPQIHNLDGKNTGGMKQLPDSIQKALTDNPVKSIPFGSHNVEHLDDLRAVGDLMSHGDKSIQGSDINRGMIKQGAELAGAATPDAFFSIGNENVGKLANSLLDNAVVDHTAVHDAIIADPKSSNPDARAAADRMNVTCDNGGKYFGNQHVLDVLEHPWAKDQHGAENMFKWIGDDASQPKGSFLNNQAGETAYSLASILGDSHNQSALNSPDNPLGAYNPALTQTLANSMSPYLGNFAGVTDANLLNSTPIDATGHPLDLPSHKDSSQLSNMFAVLDSDPDAARTINSAGMQWHDALEYAAGLNPDRAISLQGEASRLQQAMNTGLTTDITAHAAERAYQAAVSYGNKGVFADGVTSVVQTAAAITGGSVGGPVYGPAAAAVAGGIAATVDSYIKADVIPNPADPAHPLPDDKVSTALNSIKSDISNDAIRDQYLQTQGYIQQHPEQAHYFDQPGKGSLLDWQNVATGDGSGLSAWENAYGKFSHDMNEQMHSSIFPVPSPADNAQIDESDIAPKSAQLPPGATK